MTDLASRPETPAEAPKGPPSALGALAVYNLGKRYGQRTVVQDVSLVVRQGEAVGLLGPNGAGKTTVFYMITGLVKADKGVIALDGKGGQHGRADPNIDNGLPVETAAGLILDEMARGQREIVVADERLTAAAKPSRTPMCPRVPFTAGGRARRGEPGRGCKSIS